MTRDQQIVGIGAASGVVAMIVAIAGIYQLWPSSPSLVDNSSRLAYSLQANVFAVIPLHGGPDRRRLGPRQTVFFKFNTKYLCRIGVGFRFDAGSQSPACRPD